ncbi:hypothetical protein ACQRC7_06645 [Segatella copri]|uniref:hypothetical protein n=1 Tax=Segatella copri TaxID=165179 RepID=UPI003CFEE0CF
MKYIKLFMLMAAVTFFAACSSDDDSWNSASDVTVGMAQTEMTVNEGKGLFNVPIEVKGETNGNVFVTVELKEVGANPAKEDVNYYVTDKTINISDGVDNVEIETVDDDDINDPRTFQVTIVDAKGAKISENASTTITLKDNDAEFYSKLQGKWKMTGVDRDGEAVSWDVTIKGAADETEADFNKVLYITGINGEPTCEAPLTFSYDKTTRTGSVAFRMGEDVMGAYNFSIGPHLVVPFNKKDGAWSTDPITGTWSDDMKTLTFGEGMLVGRLFTYPDQQPTNYIFFSIQNIKLTR